MRIAAFLRLAIRKDMSLISDHCKCVFGKMFCNGLLHLRANSVCLCFSDIQLNRTLLQYLIIVDSASTIASSAVALEHEECLLYYQRLTRRMQWGAPGKVAKLRCGSSSWDSECLLCLCLCVRGCMLAQPAPFRQGHATLILELEKRRRKESTSINEEKKEEKSACSTTLPDINTVCFGCSLTQWKWLLIHCTFLYNTFPLSLYCLPPP